ncbi:astacin-like metalloprotease toxin 2 [Amphibalanus amphitrite]|uniref:astacin-like metalloprotease toxin 2 n=1 Tax=Amphibalanus amphitrite TaxID=1232801 RepID=UPI001C90BB8C|nr:astacin-like metalloprotease toxin 2 [Amphibalanus amphitrite]XP_043228224.1 astacin-like metalloprotease toxin 2 [Amphibalanus amphitrite]
MTRGRYQVTRLGEDEGAAAGPGCCRCSRPVRLALLVLALVLVLAAAAAVTAVVLLRQEEHRSAVYPADESRLYRGGPGVTEGDMLGLNTSSGELSATRDPKRLWPLGAVAYRTEADIGCPYSARCAVLLTAMAEYSGRTCVRWQSVEETDGRGDRSEELLVRYRPDSGCYASVGYRGFTGADSPPQLLVLGDGCFNMGILLHLLGHTLGLWHEHNRPDRDSWMDVNMTNVDPAHVDAFRTFTLNQHRVVDRLDYSSVMMFGGHAFSSSGSVTLRPHWSNSGTLVPLQNKTQLSEQDVDRVQAMYIRVCSKRRRLEES